MIVYRLVTGKYKDDLSGTGAKIYGGRWNSIGIPVLYTTENISLAVLELLVRTDKDAIPIDYHLLRLEIPAAASLTNIIPGKLKKSWKDDIEYTQWIGSEFMKANKALVLKIPSVIVEEEHNYVMNPKHPEFQKVKIRSSNKFRFDKRLFLDHE